MKIQMRYRVDYHYETVVSFSPHLFRLFPRVDRYVDVTKVKFDTNEDADVQYRRDLFDNEIARCFYPEKGKDLKSKLVIDMELRERNPFHFLLDSHALDFPFQYTPHEHHVLSPFLKPQTADAPAALPFWQPKPGATVDTVIGLNAAIHKNIIYERRDEGGARTAMETCNLGVGSCRDFSVLLAEVLRKNGVAARLASGYLCEFDEKEKRAEGALHAWVEAYLPGGGWIGMDPTNGTLANHFHITTAVGLVPEDITPVLGSYSYHNKTRVASTTEAELELIKCSA